MSYPPPDWQDPNQTYEPYTPSAPYGAQEYGQPAYTPEGPTEPGPYAPPAPPAPPAPFGGYAPPPTGSTASFGGYPPPPPPPALPGQAAPYAPPYQGQSSQALYGQQPVVYQPVVYQPVVMPERNSGAAVAVEVIAGIFGLWGIGWLMRGYTSTGIIMLVAGLLIIPTVFVALLIFTLGFGLPCLGVANIIFVIVSAVNLNNRIRSGILPQ